MHAGGAEDPLEAAAQRLDQALARVEGLTHKLRARADSAQTAEEAAEIAREVTHSTADDRARLAAALDASRAREMELQSAAQDASNALDRAIEELRQVFEAE